MNNLSSNSSDKVVSEATLLPPNNGKRPRRMRSASGAAHNGNVAKKKTSGRAKRANSTNEETKSDEDGPSLSTVPLFVQKTYRMVDEGDPTLIEWTSNGQMFVVKDQKKLAKNVIPTFFEHNNFSSFDRQLNFYGFRKIQNKPIMNEDHDPNTSKYIIYHNENFKKGRIDLLLKIERSTKHKNLAHKAEEEIRSLKTQVSDLKETVEMLKHELISCNDSWEYRFQLMEHRMGIIIPDPRISTHVLLHSNPEVMESQSTPIGLVRNSPNPLTSSSSSSLNPHPKTKANVDSSSIPPRPTRSSAEGPPDLMGRDLSTDSVGITFDAFLRGADLAARGLSNLSVASPNPSKEQI